MGTLTGLTIAQSAEFGMPTGSATTAQLNAALGIAFEQIEDYIGTNIIVSTESAEEHLWPNGSRDWNQRYNTIRLNKHHLVSVTTVTVRHDDGDCNCTTHDFTGCALVRSLEEALLDVRDCNQGSSAHCSCGWDRAFRVLVTYTAGIFSNANLTDDMKLAIVMVAREILDQMLAGSTSEMGAANITSWRSMDYSESRSKSVKDTSLGNSWISDYVAKLLSKYKLKVAFSLRKTY